MGIRVKKYQPPPRTAMEVFNLLPEGTLAEVINDIIYMSPAPTFQHQQLLSNLHTSINFFIRKNDLGVCVVAPMDVYLNEKNAFQPDILFISRGNMDMIKKDKVYGAPDIIIEVLSPGNEKHDLEKKKAVYEKSGVKEYFVVNPSNGETVTYYHNGKKFIKQSKQKGKVKSKILKKTFSF
jgi:Uma2 family endonuclease